ncbi:alkaline phosphatase [Microvirga tunisiensis]|uniref:Alkaline phosphatase n=1 Tax=Pannonibacter tanglangensis TaxID=2750084 RepID=A0A7X5F4E3_9HYPH|nr:alkaline phosphatase [Pannonibacter sp. XCT-53]NBN79543.1 alkaline phosphatase [Pannonibacter sp. XCT-53]
MSLKSLFCATALLTLAAPALAQTATTGNVIFFHPDGTSVNAWGAARMHLVGPDGELNWDRLPAMGVYTGHMQDRLTGTSHGGATVHAYGVKVQADSFGLDGSTPITAASGKTMSIAEEALAAGRAVALVQSGHIAEPGTAAFVASSPSRSDTSFISREVIESGAQVIMAGGERFLLPEGVQGRHGAGERKDGLNLIERAKELGYTVVYTREELMALDTASVDKVLGVFARGHTFNDQEAERNLIDGKPSYVEGAPTIAEMTDVALKIVSRDPEGFFAVIEEEGTDNLANSMNAGGTLEALGRADEAIGVMRRFVDANPNTLLITAADSDAGGLQVIAAPDAKEGDAVEATTEGGGILLGQQGRFGDVFLSAPDARGTRHAYGLSFVGYNDVAGGILVRGAGLNSSLIEPLTDNTEVYAIMYRTLFGQVPSQ